MRSRFQMAIAVVTVLAVSTTAVGFETPPGVEPQNGSVQVPGDNIATIPGGVAGVLQTIGSALSGILGPLGGFSASWGAKFPSMTGGTNCI